VTGITESFHDLLHQWARPPTLLACFFRVRGWCIRSHGRREGIVRRSRRTIYIPLPAFIMDPFEFQLHLEAPWQYTSSEALSGVRWPCNVYWASGPEETNGNLERGGGKATYSMWLTPIPGNVYLHPWINRKFDACTVQYRKSWDWLYLEVLR